MAAWQSSAQKIRNVLGKMTRTQKYDDIVVETKLKRTARLFEMSFFGVGNMIGAGIFILTGNLLQIAGPAGVICYLVGAVSGILTSLCYAEMSTVLPKAGSCYTFTYYTIAEVYAFVVGWTTISNCMIGYAANTKGLSAAIDALAGGVISNATRNAISGWPGVEPLGEYLDFIAFVWIWICIGIVASGAKDSLIVNLTSNTIGLVLLAIVIVITFLYGSHAEYWADDGPNGGFAPFGFDGVLQGSSIAVFAYFGFDTIANTSEEARNPKFSIPRAMAIALAVVSTVYCLACIGLSMLVPISQIDASSPFAYAFLAQNQTWAYYTSAVAMLVATCDMSYLYVLPRMLYSMGSDGLLFSVFCYIWPRTQVPVAALLIGGGITSVLALLFDISSLVNMNSIGVLLSYSTVGITLLLMRYNGMGREIVVIINVDRNPKQLRPHRVRKGRNGRLARELGLSASAPGLTPAPTALSVNDLVSTQDGIDNAALQLDEDPSDGLWMAQSVEREAADKGVFTTATSASVVTVTDEKLASAITTEVVYPRLRRKFAWVANVRRRLRLSDKQLCNGAILVFVVGSVLLDVMIVFGLATSVYSLWLFVIAFAIPFTVLIELLAFLILSTYKTPQKKGAFYLPGMPAIPCASIMINTFLIVNVSGETWLRFIIWICVGLLLYFSYGMWHSHLGRRGEAPSIDENETENAVGSDAHGVELAAMEENGHSNGNGNANGNGNVEPNRLRSASLKPEGRNYSMTALMVHPEPKRKRSISTSGPTMLTPQLMSDEAEVIKPKRHNSFTTRSIAASSEVDVNHEPIYAKRKQSAAEMNMKNDVPKGLRNNSLTVPQLQVTDADEELTEKADGRFSGHRQRSQSTSCVSNGEVSAEAQAAKTASVKRKKSDYNGLSTRSFLANQDANVNVNAKFDNSVNTTGSDLI